MDEKIRLLPSVPVILLVFQLLYIWFKGKTYFSWWWVVIILVFWTILYTLADKMSDALKDYAKSHASTLDKRIKELDNRTRRANSGNKIITDDDYELKKNFIDLERQVKLMDV